MLGPGGRPAAMGNAYTAVADGVNALYWNPAGLARWPASEVMFMHARWFQDIDYNYLAYVHGNPVGQGHLGGNITFLDYGNIDVTGINNQTPVTGMGTTDASDLALAVGYGQRWRMFDWGVNMKYIREKIASKDDYAVALDLGILCNNLPSRNLALGAMVMNIGTKLNLQSRAAELPLTFKLGGAYQFEQLPLTFTADCIIPHDDRVQVAVGGEWRVFEMLALRLGYNSENDAGNGVTAGLGFNLDDEFDIDYAYVPYGDIGDAHRLSMAYKFGPRLRQEQEYDNYDSTYHQQQPASTMVRRETNPQVEYVESTPRVSYTPTRTEIDFVQEGLRYYDEGDYHNSIIAYQQALAINPNSPRGNYNLAVTFYKIQDYRSGVEYFRRTTIIDPNNVDAHLYLGICQERLGNIQEAISSWRTAARLDPNEPTVRQLLSRYK